MKFSRYVDRYVPKGSYTFSISKTRSNFNIRIGNRSFNWWWPTYHHLYYNLDKLPWKWILFKAKLRTRLCWLKGHDIVYRYMTNHEWDDWAQEESYCRWCRKDFTK